MSEKTEESDAMIREQFENISGAVDLKQTAVDDAKVLVSQLKLDLEYAKTALKIKKEEKKKEETLQHMEGDCEDKEDTDSSS
jgi:hypothetical protein